MGKSRRVRWECPNGIHPAVLGSTRPLMDSTVRYCLPCSEEAGRLVERVAPALHRKRAAKAATAQRKRGERSAREREAKREREVLVVREVDGSLGEVDIPKTLERMIRLPVLRDLAERACPYERLRAPVVTLRRSQDKPYTSGHAPYYSWRFVVTAAADPQRIEFEEVLLHELVHLLIPEHRHDARFRSLLVLAAREVWPGVEVRADGMSTCFELDRAIVRAASAGAHTRGRDR